MVNFVDSRNVHFGLEGGGPWGGNPPSSYGVRPFSYFPGATLSSSLDTKEDAAWYPALALHTIYCLLFYHLEQSAHNVVHAHCLSWMQRVFQPKEERVRVHLRRQRLFFFAQTHVCLVCARSDGLDHADSLSTTYVSRVIYSSHMPPVAVGRVFGLWFPVICAGKDLCSDSLKTGPRTSPKAQSGRPPSTAVQGRLAPEPRAGTPWAFATRRAFALGWGQAGAGRSPRPPAPVQRPRRPGPAVT